MKKLINRILDNKIFKVIWILYASFSIIFVFFLADNLLCKDYKNISDNLYLNNNWQIDINDEHYDNVSLDYFYFDKTKIGDVIKMKTTLPSDWDYFEPALCLHIRQTTVNMMIDGEIVYQYGHDRLVAGKTVGSGIQFIDFSNDYKGKEMELILTVSENEAFSKFDSMWLCEWKNGYRYILTENRLAVFLGCFFVIFGLLILIIAIFAMTFSRRYARVMWLAIFSLTMGLWTLCYYNVVMMFSIPLYSVSLMEYMSLFICPIPMIMYMQSYVKQIAKLKYTVVYWILFVIQFTFTVVSITLHTNDIVHSAAVLKYFHYILVAHLIFFTVVLCENLKKSMWNKRLYFTGLLSVVACIAYDLISYMLNRYYAMDVAKYKGISAFGVVLFLAILILDLYYDMAQTMLEERERETLIMRAYTDELTQMYNRRYCSEYMEKIQKEDVENYTIVSFDLNGLKKTNDTYGHLRGDMLIQRAAEVITEAFSKAGIVGRMGGDEFVAILNTNNTKEIKLMTDKLDNLINEKNESETDLNLSISYGFATNEEIDERNVEKLYQIADNRMYDNKKAFQLEN